MSAQPSEPPPGYEALERRLAAVEEYQRHVLPHDIAQTRGAVGLLHADLRNVSQEVTRQGQRLDQVAAEVSDVARAQIEHGAALAALAGKAETLSGRLDATQKHHTDLLMQHGRALEEILRRLPE